MKKTIFGIVALLLLIGVPRMLQAQTYVFDKTIALPGDAGYDYLAIDTINRRLYVSHGTSFNVIDLNTEQPIGVIDGLKGVHGIAIVNKSNRGFISDGRANAVVAIDLKSLAVIKTIPVDGKGPDGIIYDSYSDRVYCINGESNSASVIDPNTLAQVGTVDLGGGPEFAVSDGKGKIYNNLEDKNSLNVIDVTTLKVIQNYPLAPCGGPTGIALDAQNNRVFVGCRQNKGMSVVDLSTGKVTATIPIGAGVDAVIYDAARKLIFCSNGDATTTIIKQESADNYSVIQTLATKTRAKTMAFDAKTNKIYLSAPDFEPGTRKILPNSFKVLVYKPQ
jgi:YVTN family beta-propeller protein